MANNASQPIDNKPAAGKNPAQTVTKGLGNAIDKSKKGNDKDVSKEATDAAKEVGLITSGHIADFTA